VVEASRREVPEGYYRVPLGKARIVREGDRAHRARLRHHGARRARPAAEDSGIDAEVIDLRTLLPLDIDCDRHVGEEDRPLRDRARSHPHLGYGAELAALVQEHCFYHLEAPIERVTGL
jgi:2-oxoisovalerate dehydrogenase E1 component beta subunit